MNSTKIEQVLKSFKKPFSVCFWGGLCDEVSFREAKCMVEEKLKENNIEYIDVITDNKVNTQETRKKREFHVQVKYKESKGSSVKTLTLTMKPNKSAKNDLPAFEIIGGKSNKRWYEQELNELFDGIIDKDKISVFERIYG
jgi:hypothetical protein